LQEVPAFAGMTRFLIIVAHLVIVAQATTS
jgi:hypothetical protein